MPKKIISNLILNKTHLLCSLVLLTFIIYLPTLFFHYVYLDDYLMVQEPGFHSNLSNIPGSFFRSIWPYSTTSYQYYRPVSISLYILGTWSSMQISGEILPWVYHLTNIILQIGVVALLFNFFCLLGNSFLTSAVATMIFAVHPALAGTVGWIPGQNELLLAVFILSAFITLIQYTKTQQSKWLIYQFLFFLGALLVKENAIVFPALAFFYLKSVNKPLINFKLIFIWILSFITWFCMLKFGAGQSSPVTQNVVANIFEHMHYAFVYLGKLAIPYPLSTLPTFHDTNYLTLGAGIAVAFLFASLFFRLKNRWSILFGMAWFTAFLLPTFAVAGGNSDLNFILREDRGYLAAVGVWLIALQIQWPTIVYQYKIYFLGLIVSLFICLNVIHQQNYGSGKAFYTNAVEGSPNLAFAHTHLADMYLTEGHFEQAIDLYKKAIELNYFEPQAHNNLGVAYMRKGQSKLAIEEFRIELSYNPNNILALFNLGVLLAQENKIQEAEELFRKAVTINPVYTDAWGALVKIYTYLNDQVRLEEAKKGLSQSEWDMSKGL